MNGGGTRLAQPFVPRRIVTGVRDGRAVVLTDGPVPTTHAYASIPGMTTSVVYATAPTPLLPMSEDETAPLGRSVIPAPGETVLMVVTFPPDSVMMSPDFDPPSAYLEQHEFVPGLPDSFEPDAPGKHRTDTIDYDIVLDGTLVLELDNEERVLLAGDIVVQGATRHAWRNRSDRPAVMCFVLIGAVPAPRFA